MEKKKNVIAALLGFSAIGAELEHSLHVDKDVFFRVKVEAPTAMPAVYWNRPHGPEQDSPEGPIRGNGPIWATTTSSTATAAFSLSGWSDGSK